MTQPRVALYTCNTLDRTRRSLEQQAAILRSMAVKQSWEVVELFSDDLRGAGVRKTTVRAGRSNLLRNAAARNFEAVSAVGLTYMFGSFADFLDTLRDFGLYRVRVLLVEDDIDTATQAGQMMMGCLSLLRQIEGTLRAANAQAGVDAAREAGRSIGRPPANIARKMRAEELLARGQGVNEVARSLTMPKSEVSRIKSAMNNSGRVRSG